MNDPLTEEFLWRLRPIPTYRDHPATSPADIVGVDHHGGPVRIAIVGSAATFLLLFLSSTCLGCRDLWEGTTELRRSLPLDVRIVIVTKGNDEEDGQAVAALVPVNVTTVMSSSAYRDYRVGGPPFLAVIVADEVRTEGVAWGIDETVRATRQALEAQS